MWHLCKRWPTRSYFEHLAAAPEVPDPTPDICFGFTTIYCHVCQRCNFYVHLKQTASSLRSQCRILEPREVIRSNLWFTRGRCLHQPSGDKFISASHDGTTCVADEKRASLYNSVGYWLNEVWCKSIAVTQISGHHREFVREAILFLETPPERDNAARPGPLPTLRKVLFRGKQKFPWGI